MKVFEKINILKIIKNHLKTLVNDNDKKPDFSDWLVFLLIPLFSAGVLTYFDVKLSDKLTNLVITTLSILVGLLFNVVVILFDIIKRDNSKNLKNRLLEEILTNISYSIFISLIIIFFTVLSFFDNYIWLKIMLFITYFLLTHFSLTILMILKRVYTLFINEIDEIAKK